MPTKKSSRPPAECPLCGYRFTVGTLGWHTHVGTVANHPKWRPDLAAAKARQRQFQEDYPDFFKSASCSNRRVPHSDRREGMGPPSKQLVPDFMRALPPPNGGAPPAIPAAPLVLDHKATVKSEPRLALVPVAVVSAAAARESLATALAEAAKAGKWDVVERLAALIAGSQ